MKKMVIFASMLVVSLSSHAAIEGPAATLAHFQNQR